MFCISFYKIILPAARPAIVAGLSLVAMETLAEFGAVDFFSINTLTTGIYNSWIAFDDLAFANRLSFFLWPKLSLSPASESREYT